MCLIDHRGFRLSAASILPISPPHSLVYGSDDGGGTVANTDPRAREMMKKIAERLNLRKHYAAK